MADLESKLPTGRYEESTTPHQNLWRPGQAPRQIMPPVAISPVWPGLNPKRLEEVGAAEQFNRDALAELLAENGGDRSFLDETEGPIAQRFGAPK